MGRIALAGALVVGVVAATLSSAWADRVYTFNVKGVVKGLPGQGRASNEVLVQHEAIPEYRDTSGTVVGMAAMTMPFYLKDGVALNDITVGDQVEFTVEQRLDPPFSEKVIAIKER